MAFFDVAPRWSAGSPALLDSSSDRRTAESIQRHERDGYRLAFRSDWNRNPGELGLTGIVLESQPCRQGWICRDLLTGRSWIRPAWMRQPVLATYVPSPDLAVCTLRQMFVGEKSYGTSGEALLRVCATISYLGPTSALANALATAACRYFQYEGRREVPRGEMIQVGWFTGAELVLTNAPALRRHLGISASIRRNQLEVTLSEKEVQRRA